MSRRRRKIVTIVVLLVIVAAAAVVGIWRVLSSAPEEVSLPAAVADAQQAQDTSSSLPQTATETTAVADTPATTGAPTATVTSTAATTATLPASTAPTTPIDGINGNWSVDTEAGSFTLEDATGSFAGFRVKEELAQIGAFTAVGRTGDVSGTMEIVDETVTSVVIQVDLTTLRTDDSRRDGAVQRALGTSQYPTATFTLTEVLEIEDAVVAGAPMTVTTQGDLTVNGVTQPVVVDIAAQLVGNVIAVVGSVEVTFADFDVSVPQVPIVLSAEDHGIMEFQILFKR